ncbi:hypothetical protein HDF16_000141 [Granulicella aggregans]|uniref:Uncharacterized protein n=1 Tax=Granulicella aggregans TaxID=474949 RepID=A0A7W8E1I4_9BACT|nr:hypothetical protein [Granulicella aggregans]MBB5055472.1 hypothetical protein [Granulicella aggregans]
MAYEYIDKLGVGASTCEKLRSLGVATPHALLSKLEFSPEDSVKFLGRVEFEQVVRELKGQGAAEADYGELPPFRPSLGARFAEASPASLHERDQRNAISAEIAALRKSGDCTSETQQRLQNLEQSMRDSLKASSSR